MKAKPVITKPIVLITGATSGIGRASAIRFAKEGYRLILTARRAVTLKKLGSYLENQYKTSCYTYPLDVRKLTDIRAFMETLPAEWHQIGVLVNNAGLAAGLDPVQEGSTDDWDQMIDTNIKGMLYMTRLVAPGMIERRKGHIINIGSIAGKEVYPKGAVYCATKHAVEALTKGMRQDLVPYGIKVSSVCPGAVETEFSLVRFKGDEERADKVYDGFTPLQAEDVASVIHYIVSRPAHVNIQDVLIMPAAQASATIINRQ
ncbi:MAG: NAD(P)-dependent oxidoreductase [Bacteroidetes bacterium GWF2_49_14]|nr:MAG: NAD(P)-dependent oxidoreductase [Bacteroidetes bacterium GWF2_49_14]HBB90247.1 NAD(P)-dependent oxidoreductase [Bacteroidales bacterium]